VIMGVGSGADGSVRSTVLHRWPAALKLGLLLVISVVLVSTTAWPVLAVAALFFMGLLRWLTGPWSIQSLLSWRWSLLGLLVLAAYVAVVMGLPQALAVVFRLLALISAAIVVMSTTRTTDLMGVVEALLKPFGRLGWIDPVRVALLFGIVIRFMPVLIEQWNEIQEAQASRGLSAKPYALLVPMLARTLQRADEVAEAIDARGMGGHRPQNHQSDS